MPRDSSGDYTLPAGNPVITGTLIETSWANPTMSDLGAEMTNSLDRQGRGGMLAEFRIVDGAVTSPGLGFINETNTGLYLNGGSALATFAVLGQDQVRFSVANQLEVFRDAAWHKVVDAGSASGGAVLRSPSVSTQNVIQPTAVDVIALTLRNIAAQTEDIMMVVQDSTGVTNTFTLDRRGNILIAPGNTTVIPIQVIAKDAISVDMLSVKNEGGSGVRVASAGNFFVENVGSAQSFIDKGASGDLASLHGRLSGLDRWRILLGDTAAESGSNVGSDFIVQRFNDAGASLGNPISIARNTGVVDFAVAPTVAGSPIGGAGIWKKIGQIIFSGSNAGNMDFADGANYETLRLVLTDFHGSTATTLLGVRFRNGGSDIISNSYFNVIGYITTIQQVVTVTSTTFLLADALTSNYLPTTTNNACLFVMDISRPTTSGQRKTVAWIGHYQNIAGTRIGAISGSGEETSTQDIEGINIFGGGGGGLLTGRATLYGLES